MILVFDVVVAVIVALFWAAVLALLGVPTQLAAGIGLGLFLMALFTLLFTQGASIVSENKANAAPTPDLVEELANAAKRLDFLASWIENTYGGTNQDVELGRSYARRARAAIAAATGEPK